MNKYARFSSDWAVALIVVACIAVWALNVVSGMNAFSPKADDLLRWGGNAASNVQNGEWWRLLSAMFLHGGALHLALNMYALWGTGTQVTQILGNRSFLIIYFGAGLMGSALSLHYSAQTHVSVGASGAIFGVVGAFLVLLLRHKDQFPIGHKNQLLLNLAVFTVYSLFQGFAVSGIDNAAHIGGLVGGVVIGLFMTPLALVTNKQMDSLRNSIAIGVSALAVCLLVFFSPPASRNLADFSSNVATLDAALNEFSKEAIQLQTQMNEERVQVNAGQIPVETYARSVDRLAAVTKIAIERLSRLQWGRDDPIGRYAEAELAHYQSLATLLDEEAKAVRSGNYDATANERKALAATLTEKREEAQALRAAISSKSESR